MVTQGLPCHGINKCGFAIFQSNSGLSADGIVVIDAAKRYSNIVGGKILKLNQLPIDAIVEQIVPLLPLDSKNGINGLLPYYLVISELLGNNEKMIHATNENIKGDFEEINVETSKSIKADEPLIKITEA